MSLNTGSRPLLFRVGDRLTLRRRASVGKSVRIHGRVWVHGRGRILVEDQVVLDARDAPIELHAHRGAVITVGRGAVIESGASIEATARVVVGPGARLGAFCKIMDNNFHPLDRENRLPPSRPVFIGAGATIGPRAILLPGAWIGAGATVPGGAVVSRRFGASPDALATFNPTAADEVHTEIRPRVAVRSGVVGKVQSAIEIARSLWYLRGCDRGRRVHAGGPVVVANRGRVRIGSQAVFVGGMISTAITCGPGASIGIGSETIFNYGVSLDAGESIRIGERCRFGSYVRISDRAGELTLPVVVEDDVWIAHGAVIEPGVTIGSGSVVSAGSRVITDVPPGSLAIGNPARCMSLSLRTDLLSQSPRSGGPA
jgi:acetyltransferase-like isoleucine patch superfamily enzyme